MACLKKILVIGTSGSGKSTLAKKIALKLDLPYCPTDRFYWKKDWQPEPSDRVREKAYDFATQPEWVMDGNFDSDRDIVWKEADCILWLNYPRLTVLYRVLSRNLRWWVTQEEIWSGNRMTLKHAISGIRHAMRSYGKKKRDYPLWLKDYETVVVFRSSRQALKWMKKLSGQGLTLSVP